MMKRRGRVIHGSVLKKEMCDDKLRDLIYDLAQKTGRSTLAIRYKLLNLLVKALPADTVVEKVTIMVKR